MKLKHKQLGVSPIGVLVIILVAGFFVMSVVKLMPLYQDYYLAKGIMANLKNEPDVVDMTEDKILSLIERQLTMNSVRSVAMDDFFIDVGDRYITVELNYESREPLMFNLDVVAKFDYVEEIDLRGR